MEKDKYENGRSFIFSTEPPRNFKWKKFKNFRQFNFYFFAIFHLKVGFQSYMNFMHDKIGSK